MKTRPILFSGEMVRAILDGRKTQTRRVVKPKDSWLCAPEPQVQHEVKPALLESGEWGWIFDGCTYGIIGKCPYGQPGDELYVREACAIYQVVLGVRRSDGRSFDEIQDPEVVYRADGWGSIEEFRDYIKHSYGPELTAVEIKGDRWIPSIHMPRWASRITLRVKRVWVERVQDISGPDCAAEGLQLRGIDSGPPLEGNIWKKHRDAFKGLWDNLNAKRGYGWETNPWVRAVEFEVKP